MDNPTLTDYAPLMDTLFELFMQWPIQVGSPKPGKPFTNTEKPMIVFFTMTQLRRIFRFKAQCRWLEAHRKMASLLGWVTIPYRTTLSRRYKVLYATICRFVLFIAQYAPDLDARFSPQHLIEDKSLFKVLGPVWHQSDRKAGRIPDKLRNLDTDATWSKSSYHGWVYGYGLHMTCNEDAFPALVQVETGAVSESALIDQKADHIIGQLAPDTLAAGGVSVGVGTGEGVAVACGVGDVAEPQAESEAKTKTQRKAILLTVMGVTPPNPAISGTIVCVSYYTTLLGKWAGGLGRAQGYSVLHQCAG
jgi:hypothetical protein